LLSAYADVEMTDAVSSFVYCDITSLIEHIIISARKRIIPHYNLRQAVSLVLGKIVCFVL